MVVLPKIFRVVRGDEQMLRGGNSLSFSEYIHVWVRRLWISAFFSHGFRFGRSVMGGRLGQLAAS